MGGLFACPKCETEVKNESVINISDSCILRVTGDEVYEKSTDEKSPQTDEEWIRHLKCLDEIHSLNGGLTPENIEKLIEDVEQQIGSLRESICSSEKVIACLSKHQNCSIRCKRYVDEFIDCINKNRIEIIKENAEERERCRLLQTNELANEFLKGGIEQEIKTSK